MSKESPAVTRMERKTHLVWLSVLFILGLSHWSSLRNTHYLSLTEPDMLGFQNTSSASPFHQNSTNHIPNQVNTTLSISLSAAARTGGVSEIKTARSPSHVQETKEDNDFHTTTSLSSLNNSRSKPSNESPFENQMAVIDNDKKNPLLTQEIALHKGDRKIVFVHVGKTGGTTISKSVFRHFDCNLSRRGAEQKRACHESVTRTDSPLRESALMEIHMHPLGPVKLRTVKRLATTFMFTIRNPLDRIVSAYHFEHYNNADASVFARRITPERDEFYKTCFPRLQDMLDAIRQVLQPDNNTTNVNATSNSSSLSLTRCQQLALDSVQGNTDKYVNLHLNMNYEKYMACSVDLVPHKEVFVVRLKHFWQDVVELDKRTGGSGDFSGVPKISNRATPSTKRFKKRHGVIESRQDYQNMCCVLLQEIRVYQRLILMGENLHGPEKEEALLEIYQTCDATPGEDGLVDWGQWQQSRNCPDMKIFAAKE